MFQPAPKALYVVLILLFSTLFVYIFYFTNISESYLSNNNDNNDKNSQSTYSPEFSWMEDFEVNTSLTPHMEPCEKSVVFSSANWAGIGSLLNTQLSVMLWAHYNNRSFFLIDNGWNYGRWFNYWSSNTYATVNSSMYYLYYDEQHHHQCTAPKHVVQLEKGMNADNYTDVGVRIEWNLLGDIFKFNAGYEDQTKEGIYRYESLFKLKSNIANSFWKLQPQLQAHANGRKAELQLKNYIAIHIRRGDKIIELPDGKFTPITKFYDEIENIFNAKDNKLTAKNTKILVLSDDYSIMKNLTTARDWDFVTTYPESSPFNTNVSYTQAMFNGFPEPVRQAHGLAFVTQMELMRLADYVICTHTSNVCRLISLLRGWDDMVVQKKLISLDIEWHPL
ncbi:unnamed protein product [Cunninghamella blakesleeana]